MGGELAATAAVKCSMDQTGRRRFGEYEIDLGTGELRRNGQPVPLQRQPARVLARLVAEAGALVLRQQLHDAVWADRVHVDFDRGLNYCIRQLRQALGDDAKAPRFIETVARQGYRFVGDVTAVGTVPATANRTIPGDSDPVNARPFISRRFAMAAAAVALLVIGFTVDRVSGGNPEHHEMAAALVRAVHAAVF